MIDSEKFRKNRLLKQGLLTIIFLVILIGGWWLPILGYFLPLCMILGVAIAMPKGRKWCDWLCPRGSFYDFLIKPLSLKKDIPNFLKSRLFRIGFVTFFITMVTIQLINRWPDIEKIGAFFIILLTITTIIGLALAFPIHYRAWCRFCPIGSMANWVGKGKLPLKIDSDLCKECSSCSRICPININPVMYKSEGIKTVEDDDCLKCNLCVAECPEKALSL